MTENELRHELIELHSFMSLRKIAEEIYNNDVSHGVVARCIRGIYPKKESIREALGLPPLVSMSACPVHGIVHLKKCPQAHKNNRPRRIAIRCDDMTSAAKSITKNLPPKKVRELIEELKP